MKKVWLEIKLEFAFAISEMLYCVNRYILKHGKSFNKKFKEFMFNWYLYWIRRFDALYEELELSEQ